MKIKMTSGSVAGGKILKIGKEYDLEDADAKLMLSINRAVLVQESDEQAVDEITDEDIVAAVKELDPEEDAHWTKKGEPDLNVLTETLGVKVTRKQLNELLGPDGFTREDAAAVGE